MNPVASLMILAQQGTNAYETGRLVGRITAIVLVVAVVLWVVGKLFGKR